MKNNLRATRGVTTLAFTITGLLLMTISVLLVNRQIQLIYNVQQRDYQQEQSMQLAEATLVKVQNNLRLNVWRDLWISDGDQDGWLGVAGKGNAKQYNEWAGQHQLVPSSYFRVLFSNPVQYDFRYLRLHIEVCYSTLCAIKARLNQTLKIPANNKLPTEPLTVLGDLGLVGQIRLVHANSTPVARVTNGLVRVSPSVQITDANGTRQAKAIADPAIEIQQKSLSTAAFFQQVMDNSAVNWQGACHLMQCQSGCDEIQFNAVLQQAPCVWVKGDLTLAGYQEYGSQKTPLHVVVEGDLHILHQAVLNGLVYLKNSHAQFNGREAWQINGALVAEGQLEIQAPVTLNYKKEILEAIPHMDISVPVSGTWTDASL